MKSVHGIILFLIAAALSQAQTISISGTVKDTGGVGIAGATVRLEATGISVISRTDGSFTLAYPVGVSRHLGSFSAPQASVFLYENSVLINARKKADVMVKVYGADGKLLSSQKRNLCAGKHTIAFPQLSTGLHVYQVWFDNVQYTFRNIGLENIAGIGSQVREGKDVLANSAKTMARISDIITVTKEGFLTWRDSMKTSDTSGMTVTMISSAGTMTDLNGHVYQTVRFGTQVWTVENLRTTKFNDGTDITLLTTSNLWYVTKSPGYGYYECIGDSATLLKYGALYNGYAVETGKLAPEGWHIPSLNEWQTMLSYLTNNGYGYGSSQGFNSVAKSMAARTDWIPCGASGYRTCYQNAVSDRLSANNRSGFNALPGGLYDGNYFDKQKIEGYWWSSTKQSTYYYYGFILSYGDVNLNWSDYRVGCGMSVRLVKDD